MKQIELKSYLENDNKSGYKTKETHIKIKFPKIYDIIINHCGDNWMEKLYNYVNNITDIPVCKQCGKKLHVIRYGIGYKEYCSISCVNKSIEHKEKNKKTSIEKYGVDNPAKSEIVKEKIKSKLFINDKWYNESDEFKNKSKQTNLRKYGVEHFSKTNEYHEKVKKSNIEKYGVDSYNKTDEYKECMKKQNLKKYGVEYTFQSKEFKNKSKQTNLRKYGVEYYCQTNESKERIKQTNLRKYGAEYIMQTEEFKKRTADIMIQKYGEIWLNYAPKYNVKSIYYLDMLSEKLNLHIQHALNGGEKKFVKYWVDGYIEQYNICIEWDERHHNGNRQKERDLKKELFLKENFSCIIFRINENEFLKNVETSMENISGLISKLISKL